MHDQSLAAIEVNKKILCPSAQAFDLTAFQSRDEISWKRDSQVSTAKVDSYKPASCENWNKSFPNGFDFRKFRHKRCGCVIELQDNDENDLAAYHILELYI